MTEILITMGNTMLYSIILVLTFVLIAFVSKQSILGIFASFGMLFIGVELVTFGIIGPLIIVCSLLLMIYFLTVQN